MSEDGNSQPVKTASWFQQLIILAVLMLVAFLLGFGPMWYKLRESTTYIADVEQQLNLARLQNTLGSSVIDAHRGDYETARLSASDFFSSLISEKDRSNDSDLTQAQKAEVTPLFARRDEIITLLARSDPASADRLSDLYVSYRKLMIK